jgi:hypothetical protein
MAVIVVDTEWDVTRRIGWDESEDLASHADRVVDALRQNSDVTEVSVEASLDSGRASVHLVLDTWEINRIEFAKALLGVAIRSAGGQHIDLLPNAEVEGSNVDRAQWSPLRGPTWKLRHFATGAGDDA